jgi:hypothetical protein
MAFQRRYPCFSTGPILSAPMIILVNKRYLLPFVNPRKLFFANFSLMETCFVITYDVGFQKIGMDFNAKNICITTLEMAGWDKVWFLNVMKGSIYVSSTAKENNCVYAERHMAVLLPKIFHNNCLFRTRYRSF